MATYYSDLYENLSRELNFDMDVFLDRGYWLVSNTIFPADMLNIYNIIDRNFNGSAPDIAYSVKVAVRCTLIRPYPEGPYGCEDVFELAVRNAQQVLSDYKYELINTLHHDNHSALVIQRQWKKCISNPEYKLCKGRLLREFDELAGSLPLDQKA